MESSLTFNFVTTRYSPKNAYLLAKASALAYLTKSQTNIEPNEEKILSELQSLDPNFSQVKGFNHKSSQSFVAKHQNFIIAAFRGTDNWQDWLDNLNLPSIPLTMGRVHRGFQLALIDVWDSMLETIDSYKDNGQTLWITGHSLGGALATLAAVERVEKDLPFNGVYTFGQPRCLDRQMARNLNIEAKGRIFRFQNNRDIVSRIPQRLMGYSHAGTLIYIDSDKQLHTDIHWWNQFLDRTTDILEELKIEGIDRIEDHNIEEYINALLKNIDDNLFQSS